MEPAAVPTWITLAVGFLLWALGDAVPVEVSPPYSPQVKGKCGETEYYSDKIQMCCDKCPPGQRVLQFCTTNSNTVCGDCEEDTYTEVWNWIRECHSCRRRCNRDLVETQNCTRKENRMCGCKSGFFCVTGNPGTCLQCLKFAKCPKGSGVAKQGTSNSNVKCAPCGPGTFSDTISSTDTCKPHRVCHSVAVPGNATSDAICSDMVPVTITPDAPLSKLQPETMNPNENSVGTSPQPQPQPTLHQVISNDSVLPLGWILGLMVLIVLLLGLASCFMFSQRKKKLLSCIKEETKVPHPTVEKSQSFLGHNGTEQQNLLGSEATSSSNSLDSMLSSGETKEFQEAKGVENHPPQAPSSEKSKCGQETRAGSMDSEHSHGGGTQVNVTCIVNVCNSDHSSQCSSRSSCPDFEARSSGSPRNEDVPFSQEESPRKGKPGSQNVLENLLPDLEEKPLPIGIQDMGMKFS
ncbi:tumor necrosis factor receptor superfamily member 1B isoform X1 [Antechinus flavipes]|uniref:tumor necrosis factor receptor superfamily member 1B isoform X1 n=2 Tax=Antechinus flavipes TaxID=38775 RepID=UPI0022365BB0|nr:tumor necrosis factor receptor superfamily member 1B isoform X1 [Antechinus flavipes]